MTNHNRTDTKDKPKYVGFGKKELDKELRKRFNKLATLRDDFTSADSHDLRSLAFQEWNYEQLAMSLFEIEFVSTQRLKNQRAHTEIQKNINELRKTLKISYSERTKNDVATVEIKTNPMLDVLKRNAK